MRGRREVAELVRLGRWREVRLFRSDASIDGRLIDSIAMRSEAFPADEPEEKDRNDDDDPPNNRRYFLFHGLSLF